MKNTNQEFRSGYLRAIALASVAFAVIHGSQLIITGLISQRSLNLNPTGFLVLVPYVKLEAVVFFLSGYIIAYFPSRAGSEFFRRTERKKPVFYELFGMIIGVIFLPVCASVPFFVFPIPDDRSYIARCVEFALPMTIAGAVGGYTFWRCTRRTSENSELVAGQFS